MRDACLLKNITHLALEAFEEAFHCLKGDVLKTQLHSVQSSDREPCLSREFSIGHIPAFFSYEFGQLGMQVVIRHAENIGIQ